ncbi:hypothetical protein [Macromonas nakdongensis]|uniref:hypothetical protein n=1 Tax=Macromonas nakdongensis TaxID=1843082 RepID=UPI000C337D30|nr:hypothetical protein [Macromonas nakdongensis]
MSLTPTLPQWASGQAHPDVVVNANFKALQHMAVYANNPDTTDLLTWGYLGGRWGGFAVAAGTLTLTASATNYIVVARATGVVSTSTATTNWDNADAYARVYRVTTGTVGVTAVEDHRAGDGGIFPAGAVSAGGGVTAIPIACSDETTALTAGTAKVTFRMPFAMTLTAVRSSLTTAQTSGSILTVDINEGGTSILSTKLTIDNTERTSTTAATAAVISDAALADDAEMTIDIDQVGDGTAKGLKVYLIGVPA